MPKKPKPKPAKPETRSRWTLYYRTCSGFAMQDFDTFQAARFWVSQRPRYLLIGIGDNKLGVVQWADGTWTRDLDDAPIPAPAYARHGGA